MRSDVAAVRSGGTPRVLIEEFSDHVLVKVPARRNYIMSILAGFVVVAFSIAAPLVFVADILLVSDALFSSTFVKLNNSTHLEAIIFISFWLAGASFAITWLARIFFWLTFGYEVIAVSRQNLVHRICVPLFSRTGTYSSSDVHNLRWLPGIAYSVPMHPWLSIQSQPPGWLNPWSVVNDAIAFEQYSKTVRMAFGVDKAEAETIVAAIRRRLSLEEVAA